MPALYLTIWVALVLFAVGETGRSLGTRRSQARDWGWWAFSIGLTLAIVHTLLAFALVHEWVHDDAFRSTALQTEAVFGIAVGWGVYVNYAFLAVWLADAWWWRASPAHTRPPALVWTLRAFYMLIIFNGAVIFASGWRRALGLLIVSWLARIWAPVTGAPSEQRRRSSAGRTVSR